MIRGLADILLSMRMALLYCRAHAKSPLIALKNFYAVQGYLFSRLLRIGWCKHVQLLNLENQCALAGLNFSQYRSKDIPIWILPEKVVVESGDDMPEHPLVDSKHLPEAAVKIPDVENAAAYIRWLLDSDGISACQGRVCCEVNPEQMPSGPGAPKVAVYLHVFYPELWPAIFASLKNIATPWDLFISTPYFAHHPMLEQIRQDKPEARFFKCVNRGRDILPFLQLLRLGVFERYDVVCKLHTKRSLHMSDGGLWLSSILDSLFGVPGARFDVLAYFRNAPALGLLGPASVLIEPTLSLHRGKNEKYLNALISKFTLPESANNNSFFAGTMFWFRPAAFSALVRAEWRSTDFQLEMAQTDGTIAHAYERMFWPLVVSAGYGVDKINLAANANEVADALFRNK